MRFTQDPSYSKLFASVLSTSNCGTRALDLFGFGPVVDDGFGLGYMIHPEVPPPRDRLSLAQQFA
jgi:carnitine O-acetyltransferase